MAGLLRPNEDLIEGKWTVNNAVAGYGDGITNLFDAIRGDWNNGNTFYWNSASTFIDITLNQKSVIWILPSQSYPHYNDGLNVSVWNNQTNTFDFLSKTKNRTTVANEWEKMIELEAGRYKFAFATTYRMDDEWFIESPVENKVLLKSKDKTYSFVTSGYGEVLNKGGIATASAQNTPPANAFSGSYTSTTTTWWLTPALSLPAWIQYKLPEPKSVDVVRIVSYYSTGYEAIKDFKILGSNTGAFSGEENLLFTGIHPGEINTEFVDYKFSNSNSYLYYRIAISSLHPGNSGNNTSIAQIEFRKENNFIFELPKADINNFLKYGANKSIQLNNIFTSKSHILQDNTSEDTEGLWTTKINRKPLNIKFD